MRNVHVFFGVVTVLAVFFVGTVFPFFYPFIHAVFFPSLPEAEVQTYLLSVAAWIIVMSCVYWIFPPRFSTNTSVETTLLRRSIVLRCIYVFIFAVFISIIILFFRYIHLDFNTSVLLDQAGFSRTSYDPIIIYLLIAVLFLLFPFFKPKNEKGKISVKERLMGSLLIIPTIILLTFHVGYLSIYDFTHYAGPIHDMLSGLPPLSSVSYYGFLGIPFLAKIFSLVPLTLINLHIVFAVSETLGFIGYYVLSLQLFRSPLYAFVITILGISANWLTGIQPLGSLPQTTLFRSGVWIVFAIILYKQSQNNSKNTFLRNLIVNSIAVLSLFWAFDQGIYLVSAYIIHGYLFSLTSTIRETLNKFIAFLMPFMYAFAFLFAMIEITYYYFYGIFPDWMNVVSPTISFMSGSLLIALPHSIIPWLILTPPIAYICRIFIKRYASPDRQCSPKEVTMHFIAWYGMFQFLYFIGRSHPNNLHYIVLPNIICLFAIIEDIIQSAKTYSSVAKAITHAGLACMLAYPLAILSMQSYLNIRQENFITSIQTIRAPKGTEKDNFGETARLVKEKYQYSIDSDNVGILALYDTWYLILLHAKNRVGSNCLLCVHDARTYKKIAETIRMNHPEYVLTDIHYISYVGSYYDQVSHIFPYIHDMYRYKETLGLLDVYKKIDGL